MFFLTVISSFGSLLKDFSATFVYDVDQIPSAVKRLQYLCVFE